MGEYVPVIILVLISLLYGGVELYKHGVRQKHRLNKEMRWGGWFRIVKNVYATDREEYYVEYWNQSSLDWYNDTNRYVQKSDAEARADLLYNEVLVQEGVPA